MALKKNNIQVTLCTWILCQPETSEFRKILQVANFIQVTDIVVSQIKLLQVVTVLEVPQGRNLVHTANGNPRRIISYSTRNHESDNCFDTIG